MSAFDDARGVKREPLDHAPRHDLEVRIQVGDVAPRYGADVPFVRVQSVVVTERGTKSGLPIVDLQMTDSDGRQYFTTLTGRHVTMLAAAVAGVNLCNHGTVDP